MEQNKAERLNENVTEKMCSSDGNVVGEMCSPADTDTCRDSLSTVTKQVKKYKNRLEIRDSERFADFGSLLGSLFSCFDNSVIVCLLID